MKTLITILAGLLLFNTAGAYPIEDLVGEKPIRAVETVTIIDAFVPDGFDTDMEAFVVVNGMFHNTCYRWKEANVDHVTDTEHVVKIKANIAGGACLNVLVPYMEEINLGQLKTGEHLIKFNDDKGTYLEKTMTIE